MAATSRNAAIFDRFAERDDWHGFGYLGERENLSRRGREKLDRAVLRGADTLGWSDEQLFHFCDSRPGRHLTCGDEATLPQPDLDARALNTMRYAASVLAPELGAAWSGVGAELEADERRRMQDTVDRKTRPRTTRD